MAKKKARGQTVRISHISGGQVNVAARDIHQAEQTVNTGGGAYIEGSVSTAGGDFVGRDQLKQVFNRQEAARLFEAIYQQIDQQAALSEQDKADLQNDVREIQAEVSRGDQADEGFLARRLRNIQRMAPDILEVLLTTLVSPAAGFGAVAKLVANKMRAQA